MEVYKNSGCPNWNLRWRSDTIVAIPRALASVFAVATNRATHDAVRDSNERKASTLAMAAARLESFSL